MTMSVHLTVSVHIADDSVYADNSVCSDEALWAQRPTHQEIITHIDFTFTLRGVPKKTSYGLVFYDFDALLL